MEDAIQLQPLDTKHVQLTTNGCTYCGGPITYERDICCFVWLLVFCGVCTLCCLPERQAECASCGAKQNYSIPNRTKCICCC